MKNIKLYEEFLNEDSGDHTSEEHAIAHFIAEQMKTEEETLNTETSGICRIADRTEILQSLIKGEVPFVIQDSETPGKWYSGKIIVEIDWTAHRGFKNTQKFNI